MWTIVTALTTLALLSGASAGRIRWRHAAEGDSRRWLVNCNGSPYDPPKTGVVFRLAHDYHKYCSSDWSVVKDKLAQISTGGIHGGTKMCMDATSDPANYVQPQIWPCRDGYDEQNWVFHSDGSIELRCTGLCLDVKDGYNGEDRETVVQLYNCIPGSTNQQWDYVEGY